MSILKLNQMFNQVINNQWQAGGVGTRRWALEVARWRRRAVPVPRRWPPRRWPLVAGRLGTSRLGADSWWQALTRCAGCSRAALQQDAGERWRCADGNME